ncbi:hypothetical protein E2986_02686 [Frieseomelitta varia]|uniref:Uncharacterized protein n=1 Tax=Frieseomelitta varia TaxID=561572 RepID=A0A833S4P8_9HYME|nr:hypothetical protein E2986_02686 [Frieseomelitta varia]
MEAETSCDDPQFMIMLETCLRVEIETAKRTSSELASEIKGLKLGMQAQLKTRKELKEKTESAQENILILTNTLNQYVYKDKRSNATSSNLESKRVNEISNKIELMNLNLDNDYKVMKLDCQQYENILNVYEATWQSYHERYEEFPLAKERKEWEAKLRKLQVDKMVLEYKINGLEKMSEQRKRITWLRMRTKIVEFARTISDHMNLEKKLQEYNRTIEQRRKELDMITTELAVQLKKQEEEKKDRALKLLEMPPPKINFSHMRTIYGRRSRTGLPDWKRNDENSIDTLSVDTLMLEEMCLTEESVMKPSSEISIHAEKGQNVPCDRPIDSTSPFLDQERQQVEHEDVASEVDGNMALEAIDAAEEELEQRMDQELEHMDQPSGISKDKQTGRRSEDLEEMDDLAAKRMRLISGEGKSVAIPVKDIQLDKEKWDSVDPLCRSRITKIETVRYKMPSIKNIDKTKSFGLVHLLLWTKMIAHLSNNDSAPRGSRLVDQSPGSRITTPLMRKHDQDHANPSSMFTPHRYDFSDNSDMSFCTDNMANLKGTIASLSSSLDLSCCTLLFYWMYIVYSADQISLYGGSVRDFCECSNISMPIEDAISESNANAPSTSKTHNFPRTCDTSHRRLPLISPFSTLTSAFFSFCCRIRFKPSSRLEDDRRSFKSSALVVKPSLNGIKARRAKGERGNFFGGTGYFKGLRTSQLLMVAETLNNPKEARKFFPYRERIDRLFQKREARVLCVFFFPSGGEYAIDVHGITGLMNENTKVEENKGMKGVSGNGRSELQGNS